MCTINEIRKYVSENFTAMAWDRVDLKLASKIQENSINEVQKVEMNLVENIHTSLIDMYGVGLSSELLNRA